MPWHARPVDDARLALETNLERGLSMDEARARLERHGPNRLHGLRKTPWWAVLLRQFRDALILLLLAAAGLSFAIGHVGDGLTILAIVLINGVLGFSQEWKAERALAALRSMLAPRCRVRREGTRIEIDAAGLVPGDVLELALGDRVPADIRVAEAAALMTDEAALTGESEPVAKGTAPVPQDAPVGERTSMAWMGTSVVGGRGVGIVTATGMESAFGGIAKLTEDTGRERSPLQRKLASLGRRLGVLGVAVAALVAAVGVLLGADAESMFFTAVSLAVAIVPEGLPAVVTLTLALGVRTLVRRKALLRRLPAAETLGAATVVCTDKTGTITQGEMTVQAIWTADAVYGVSGTGYTPEGAFEEDGRSIDPAQRPDLVRLLESALRCSHASLREEGGTWQVIGEPTEGALVSAASKAGLARAPTKIVEEIAFDSHRKRMTIVDEEDGVPCAHVKGAPEVILDRCTHVRAAGTDRALTAADRRTVTDAYEGMASRGLRTLALARRAFAAPPPHDPDAIEKRLTLLGLAGLIDPPRREVPGAVALARSAGIRVIMITGDAPGTACAVAAQIGLPTHEAVTGAQIDSLSDDALSDVLAREPVFSRTTPEHKVRIVRLLQAHGEIVGMTGDGVNDAPALKRADIGIAMGRRGTDVARGAADMVLTDDNFASIVGAIEEGRRQHRNIQRFVRYLLSSNAGEVLAIFVALIATGQLILLPVQILWMNLVTDGVTAVTLGLEPAHPGTMQRPPRPPREPLLAGGGAAQVALLGACIGTLTLVVFYVWSEHVDAARAQTAAFTAIIIAEKINVLNFRSLDAPLRRIGFFANPWLLVAIVSMLGLQACAVYVPFLQDLLHTVPLTLMDWVWMLLAAAPIFLVMEWWKVRAGRRLAT